MPRAFTSEMSTSPLFIASNLCLCQYIPKQCPFIPSIIYTYVFQTWSFFSCLDKKYLFDPKRREFVQSRFFVFPWFCCPWWLNVPPLESLCSPWPVRPPPFIFFTANVCPADWTITSFQLRKVPCMATLLNTSTA